MNIIKKSIGLFFTMISFPAYIAAWGTTCMFAKSNHIGFLGNDTAEMIAGASATITMMLASGIVFEALKCIKVKSK
jgi:hypothetical protein